ncbi:MAG: S41 family peptidase [Planctomycetota bacterium]
MSIPNAARVDCVLQTIPNLLFAFLVFASHILAAEQPDSPLVDELDSWKGCSLGIRLDFEDGQPIVDEVYEHVQSSSPFRAGDKIQVLGDLKFPGGTIDELSEFLNSTDPDEEVVSVVERGDEKLTLNVTTFRKEFVDIETIIRRLESNRIIKKRLEETDRSGLISDMRQRMVDAVRNSQSPREAAESLNRLIDEVDVSHTAIIPASAGLGFSRVAKGTIGLVLQRHQFGGKNGYFIIDKKPGTSSYDSALKLGDQIISINGMEIEKSRRLDLSGHEARHQLFSIDTAIGEKIEIEFVDSPFCDSQLIELTAVEDPGTVNSAIASSKVIEQDSKKVGYMRFWNLMSMGISTEFSKKVKEDFTNCDAIIMDLRGRGGIVPAVLALDRTVKKIEKPVVVIIDGLTRSAKEMLTYLLKKHDHVLVVGTRTAGAVTGATIARLPSGNSLMFPVASADSLKRFIDGAILEGVGVEPDETIEHFLPFSAGNDTLLKTALQRAASLSNEAKTTSIK